VAANTPRRGGTFTVANRADPPAGFDSMRTSSIALHHVGGSIFGPGNLVKRCRTDMYTVCPYLAVRWENSPDFKVWTFVLRGDAYWHDGTPFTAEDAKFWFDLVFFGARSGDAVRAPAYFGRELGIAESVEVLDRRRIRITFTHRNAFFPDILANPRFTIAHPRHLMEPLIRAGQVGVTPLDVGLVGLGPFRFSQYRRGSLVRVERFDRYFERDRSGNRLPYLDRIDYVIMPDPFAMDVAFRSGRLDGTARGLSHDLSQERVAAYRRDLGDSVFFARSDGGNFRLAFNMMRDGPWRDLRVRRAIALWIDKPASIAPALGGFGWTTPNIGPGDISVPTHFINWPRFDTQPLDVRRAEARRLMAEAGYPNGFTMGHLTRGIMTETGEWLKDQLSGLGVDLRLQIVDEGEWNRARVSLDYDSQQGRLSPSPIPEGTESVYGRFQNNPDAYAKHDDRAIDELYRILRDATSMEQRIEVWRRMSRYLFVDQTYIVPIAEAVQVVAYRAYVKGLVIPQEDMHTFTDFATVWLDR
ncbi:MAG: ABC transporter substrate-binding protein, partial [Spirochaetaceae bacterium]